MAKMTVNGEAIDYKLDPEMPLLWALRDASNLTGTKYGCDSQDCGACTVIIDGRAVMSCTVALRELEGAQVTTIEGLSSDGTHPVQQAWLAEQVTMCGYSSRGSSWRSPRCCRPVQRRPRRRSMPCPTFAAAALIRASARRSCARHKRRCDPLPTRRKAEHTAPKRLSTGSSQKEHCSCNELERSPSCVSF
jgi:isoquinoline 1-oxidoreductase subunit alpha